VAEKRVPVTRTRLDEAQTDSQRSDNLVIGAIVVAFFLFVMIVTTVGKIVGGIILLSAGLIEWRYPGKGVSQLIGFTERLRPGVRVAIERSILRTPKARAIASVGLGLGILFIPMAALALQLMAPAPTERASVSTTATPAAPSPPAAPVSPAEPSHHQTEVSSPGQSPNPSTGIEAPKLLPMDYALRAVHNPLKLCGKAVSEAPMLHCYQTGAKGAILCRSEESSFALADALFNVRQNNGTMPAADATAVGQLVEANGCFTDETSGILAITPDYVKMYILDGKHRGHVLYSRVPQWGWEICGDSTGAMDAKCRETAPPWPK
jgi:hypothetical protein